VGLLRAVNRGDLFLFDSNRQAMLLFACWCYAVRVKSVSRPTPKVAWKEHTNPTTDTTTSQPHAILNSWKEIAVYLDRGLSPFLGRKRMPWKECSVMDDLLCCEALSSTCADYAFTVFERLFREPGLPTNIRSENGALPSAHALFNLTRLQSGGCAWALALKAPSLAIPSRMAAKVDLTAFTAAGSRG
jgi:hypothetical protein